MVVRESQKGFTIVELLVVIAIIAILAAILFPVFGAARERGRMVACSSNCRQIYLAFRMYTQDWEKFPPQDKADNLRDCLRAPRYLMTYAKDKSAFRCPSDTWSLWQADKAKTLFPETGGKPTYTSTYGNFALLDKGLFMKVGTSYLWNVTLAETSPSDDHSVDSDGEMRPDYDPAKQLWAYDCMRSHLGHGRRALEEGTSRRAILFADGHVEMADRDRSSEVFQSVGLSCYDGAYW